MSDEKAPDEIYCPSCGEPIKRRAELCPHCGVPNEYTEPRRPPRGRDRPATRGPESRQQRDSTRSRPRSPPGSGRRSRSSPPRNQHEHDPSEYTTTVSDRMHYGVAASGAMWILGYALLGMASSAAALILLVAWILMPMSLYYDREWLRATTNWNPELPVWVLGSLIPFVNVLVAVAYLVRRSNVSQSSPPDSSVRTDRAGDPALAELRERYSRGELTDEEFERQVENVIGTGAEADPWETAETHADAAEASERHDRSDREHSLNDG